MFFIGRFALFWCVLLSKVSLLALAVDLGLFQVSQLLGIYIHIVLVVRYYDTLADPSKFDPLLAKLFRSCLFMLEKS